MLSAYPACFFKEESGYSVVFPDLSDLSTCGETLDEALRMAVDCLAGYLYWLKKDGEAAPAPSSVDAIRLADVAAELEVSMDGAFVNIITVDVEEYAKTHFEKDADHSRVAEHRRLRAEHQLFTGPARRAESPAAYGIKSS